MNKNNSLPSLVLGVVLFFIVPMQAIDIGISFNGISLTDGFGQYIPNNKDELTDFAKGFAAGLTTTIGAQFAMQPTTQLFPSKKETFCVCIQEGETIIDLTLRDYLYKNNISVKDYIHRINPLSSQGELFKSVGAYAFGSFWAEQIATYKDSPKTREEKIAMFNSPAYKLMSGSIHLGARQIVSPYITPEQDRFVSAYNKGLWWSKWANLAFCVDLKGRN